MHSDQPSSWPRLARGLRVLGEQLTDPQALAGRVYGRVERALSGATDQLSQSPAFLRASGEVLRQRAGLRVRRRQLAERVVGALRLPTASQVSTLAEQVRRLQEQVGALGAQLEVAVELLESAQRGAVPFMRRPDSDGQGEP